MRDADGHVAVHEVGAPHLSDPTKLWSSAARIYGDKMDGIIADFYYLFARRLRLLYCSTRYIWDITPCEDVKRVIAKMADSGIVE